MANALDHKPIRSEDLNSDIEAIKPPYPNSANLSYNSRYIGQSSQPNACPNKKGSCSCCSSNRRQSSNSLITRVNVIIIKENRKVNKNLSTLECCNYHKKSDYINKYPNKQSKN